VVARIRGSTRRKRRARLLIVAVAALVAFLYYRPLTSYLNTRSTLNSRRAEVSRLKAERARLETELARSTSTAELQREARRIGYVRPGEQLFIIQGITAWRRASKAGAPSMRGGG